MGNFCNSKQKRCISRPLHDDILLKESCTGCKHCAKNGSERKSSRKKEDDQKEKQREKEARKLAETKLARKQLAEKRAAAQKRKVGMETAKNKQKEEERGKRDAQKKRTPPKRTCTSSSTTPRNRITSSGTTPRNRTPSSTSGSVSVFDRLSCQYTGAARFRKTEKTALVDIAGGYNGSCLDVTQTEGWTVEGR